MALRSPRIQQVAEWPRFAGSSPTKPRRPTSVRAATRRSDPVPDTWSSSPSPMRPGGATGTRPAGNIAHGDVRPGAEPAFDALNQHSTRMQSSEGALEHLYAAVSHTSDSETHHTAWRPSKSRARLDGKTEASER